MGNNSSKKPEKNRNEGDADGAVEPGQEVDGGSEAPPLPADSKNGATVAAFVARGNAKVNIQRKGNAISDVVASSDVGQAALLIASGESNVNMVEDGNAVSRVTVQPAGQASTKGNKNPTQEHESESHSTKEPKVKPEESKNLHLTIRIEQKKDTVRETVVATDPLSSLKCRITPNGEFDFLFVTTDGNELDMNKSFEQNGLKDGQSITAKTLVVQSSTSPSAPLKTA